MLAELRERAAQALALATGAGASDAWASASRSRGVEVEVRDGAVDRIQESTSRALSLRVYVEGRYATHQTSDLRERELGRFVIEAVAMTRALEPDPFRVIPDAALFAGRCTDDLELVDPLAGTIDADTRVAWCMEAWDRAREHPRVVSASASVSDSSSSVVTLSTNGFEGSHARTALARSSSVTSRDEGDARPMGHHFAAARHIEDLPSPSSVGEEALERALRRLGAERGPTGRTTMVVDPRAGARLVGMLLGPASARALSQGRSFWRGALGAPVLSARLAIDDDPLVVRGLGSRTYDGEGIAARRLAIVRDGALVTPYADTYYARKIGMAPTTGASSNIVVARGVRGRDAIVADLAEGVLVTSWLGGNSDATTGDFSLGLRGHWIERGRAGRPVQEMNATGNVLALFRGLMEVGDDPVHHASARVPTLVFEDVQLSGA